jgi:hypothetical protein
MLFRRRQRKATQLARMLIQLERNANRRAPRSRSRRVSLRGA